MKLVIAQANLTLKGGAERVILKIAQHYGATVYTAEYKENDTFDEFKGIDIKTIGHGMFGRMMPYGRQAREFDSAIKLTGVIITKMDGSGKGGGALSATNAANSRVLFIGTGEKLKDLEPYDSDRFIEELLGIPNISKLVEHVQNAIAENIF